MTDAIRSYDRDNLIRRIRDTFPAIPINRVRRIADGQNNDVLVIDDAWVFRFPRTLEGARALAREVAVLHEIGANLPLTTPHPELVHTPDGGEAEWFAGYRRIPGRPLTRTRVQRLSPRDLSVLAGQLADFLATLHSEPLSPARRATLPLEDPFIVWSDMLARIERHLFPLMRKDARSAVQAHFSTFLASVGGETLPQALIHGDFGGTNLLLAENSPRVHAVIDWGSAAIGDPAVDYAAASTLHPDLLDLMERHNSAVSAFVDRVSFYTGTFALQEALFGAEHDDREALESGLSNYV